MKILKLTTLLFLTLILVPTAAEAEYSDWSFFGGLNLIYNSDGEGVTMVPGMQADGNPGGLLSAPSPLVGFLGVEFRRGLPLPLTIDFAPSVSAYGVQYLWANDRPLPAEIENRTSYVTSIFLDLPLLYHIDTERFIFSFGLGPGVLARYGFLESGVSADEINAGETLTAGEQVTAINDYFWEDGRWFYPTVQTGVRYKLETGWGAGFTLRAGIPLFNLWSTADVPFVDSFMILAALVITPPIHQSAKVAENTESVTDQSPSTQPSP